MSNIFRKNFHLCFSGIYAPPSQPHAPPPPPSLIKNFNTIYEITSESTSKTFTFTSSDSDDSDTEYNATPPDFATVFASQRFFFSSPGHSNSIIKSSSPENIPAVSDGVAVPTYSPDPTADFRRSMQEMIDARGCDDGTSCFEYLHELLSCYLRLNSEQNHKYVISAYSEILVELLSDSQKPPQSRRRLVL